MYSSRSTTQWCCTTVARDLIGTQTIIIEYILRARGIEK